MSLQRVRNELVELMQRVSRRFANRAAQAPSDPDLKPTPMSVSGRADLGAVDAQPEPLHSLGGDQGRHAAESRGDSDKVRAWRRRVLLKKGARIYSTMSAIADEGSFAMLDSSGVVVSWYDRASNSAADSGHVVDRHMSQFYVPEDIAISIPHRDLRVAVVAGSNTQQGWRRQPNGAVFWGMTIIDALTLRDGRLQGFALATRRSRGPWENARTAKARASDRARTRAHTPHSVAGVGFPNGGALS